MRVTVNRNQLIKSLEDLGRIAIPKRERPILSCVLIESLGDMVALTATDLRLVLTCRIPAVAQTEPGSAAVNFEEVKEIVGRCHAEEVELRLEGEGLFSVGSGEDRWSAAGLPAAEYPKPLDISDGEAVRLGQPMLKRMLELVAFVSSRDENRDLLCGVQFHISGDTITLLATDGSMLAASENKIRYAAREELLFLMPNKTADLLAECLAQDGELTLYKDRNHVLLDLNGRRIFTRIGEAYTGYDEIYQNAKTLPPAQYNKSIGYRPMKVDRLTILHALKRALKSVSVDRPEIAFRVRENKLLLTKTIDGAVIFMEEISVKFGGAKELVIGLTPRRIIPILEALLSESVTFDVSGSEKPVIIREEALYFILPTRLP
ncbi:MAG: DNA polymerase III subunit beta [Bacillota bacterium]